MKSEFQMPVNCCWKRIKACLKLRMNAVIKRLQTLINSSKKLKELRLLILKIMRRLVLPQIIKIRRIFRIKSA
ncbi:hypothetical protein D3C87_1757380 [compost metagenome]